MTIKSSFQRLINYIFTKSITKIMVIPMVFLVSITIIYVSTYYQEKYRHLDNILYKFEADINELNALKWQAIGQGKVAEDLTEKFYIEKKELTVLTKSREVKNSVLNNEFKTINNLYQKYIDSLYQEIQLINSNLPFDEQNKTVNDNFRILDISIDKTQKLIEIKAKQISHGITILIVITLISSTTFLLIFYKKLRLTERLREKVFDSSPVIMAIVSVNGYKCLEVNKSFTVYTGYTKNEVLGTSNIFKILSINIYSPEALQSPPSEINITTKSGALRVAQLSTELIHHNDEPCLLIVATDITEYKQLQKELARKNQLDIVGEMAASIGHEIRNPMTSVRGLVQLLGEKSEFNNYNHYFEIMIEEIDRANSILTEYLTMAKDKRINLKSQNLNDIIKVIAPLLEADALMGNKLIKLNLSEVPNIYIDEGEIQQIIINLVRNSLEVTPEGGNINIETTKKDDKVILKIKDYGPGINQDIIDKIGTPFLTTKDNGTGLGLAVSYSIAARHGAIITFESSEKGTTFFVIFETNEP